MRWPSPSPGIRLTAVLAALLLALVTASIALAGRLAYTLDDAYIHLALLVASVTRGAQTTAWVYDGALVTQETSTGVAPALVQWAYDSNRRVTTQTVGGVSVPYAYDDDGLLVQVGEAALVRDAATGRVMSETVGNVVTSCTYNGLGQVASIITTKNGAATPLYSEALTYDDAGRFIAIDEAVQGVATHWVYGYDNLGRLTSATKDGAPSGSWGYSGNGNRVVDGALSATFDDQDGLLTHGVVRYTYDALGGRTSMTDGSGTTTYLHDGLGAILSVRLPSGEVISYDYDGLQRRVAKRRNGAVVRRWMYDGWLRVVGEADDGANIASRFVYLLGAHMPAYMVRGGVTYVYVPNHLGSTRVVANASTGDVAQRIDYYPWGGVAFDSNRGFQPFGFAGGIHDLDTALIHFGFRDYDSVGGVWTAKDPVRLGSASTALVREAWSSGRRSASDVLFSVVRLLAGTGRVGSSAHQYMYASDDPVGRSDPTGLTDWGDSPFAGIVSNASDHPVIAIDVDHGTVQTVPPGERAPARIDWDFVVDGDNITKVGPHDIQINKDGSFTNVGWLPSWWFLDPPRPANLAERQAIQDLLNRQKSKCQ